MNYITLEEAIKMHQWSINYYGGENGILDKGKLTQCLNIPQEVYFGKEIYSNVLEKASAYLYYLTTTHSFVDGNKRIAFLVTYTFLRKNNHTLKRNQEEIVDFILSIANGKESYESTKEWLFQHIQNNNQH